MVSKNRRSNLQTAAVALLLLAHVAACDSRAPGASSAPTDAQAPRVVRVAAAADLKFALEEIIAVLHRANPIVRASATYGSSGALYAQIANGAPFDVFLSADPEYPRRLVDAGMAQESAQFGYARGRLVVWVARGSKINVQQAGIAALRDPAVRRIAIANPQHAPYGRAAVAAMRSLGVYDAAKDRLVLGENIAQTAQFVESGAADIGVIALSLAIAPAMSDHGDSWIVPAAAHPPIEQCGVILSDAADAGAAQLLRAVLTGGEGQAILRRHGFELPGE